MKKFIVEDAFWSVFPEARIGAVVCRGIDNSVKDAERYGEMLRQAEKEAHRFFEKEEFSSNPVVAVWREAFQKFKTKKGARASIEALLKRVNNGGQIGTINPLVDIYNSISLRYGLPCGGEDIDRFDGDLRLTMADGTEPFIPLGEEENSPPYEGEIVYKDDAGAVCRCWNWRESLRTILTEDTKNAFLCIELANGSRTDAFEEALKELAALVSENLGAMTEIRVLDREHKEIVIAE